MSDAAFKQLAWSLAMSFVLVFIFGASALAFFGCFLLGICHDGRHARKGAAVEVVRLSGRNQSIKTGPRDKESA